MASFPSLPFPTISGGRTASASASTSGANTTSSSSNTTSNNTATASARPPSPSTPSVSGSSIFETRRAYVPEDTDAGSLRTAITDDDRSGSPAPSLNMPRAAGVSSRGKRKRLSKACDSCHKSKRRCDGTSPCANCDFAGKPCVYTDANGRTVPPPRSREHEEEYHPTNRPRRHSVSVAHILTHGQHNPEERGGLTYATSALPMAPLDPHHPRPPIPIPGQHHLIPPQPPRPFDTPVPPPPSYYYPYYRRPESESEEDIRARNRRRYESFPPPEPAERGLYLGLNIVSPRTSMGRLCGDKGALTVEPHLARELVNRKYTSRASFTYSPLPVFFNNQYLASFMFHRPTFMLALTKGQVPMPLLNSIFALAAPYSSQPSLRTNPSWHAGERFAQFQAANAELFDQSGQLALRPDLAVAQALSLLVLHECVMRRPTTNDRHMCIAFQIMKDLGVATMDDPATFPSSSTPERDMLDQWISSECHRRTFWVLYVLESLSSAFTSRPMTFKDSQLKVRLPVDEASFEFGLRGESSSEYLQFPMPQAKPSSTGEFGHLVRVTWIYTTVMNQIAELNKKGRPPGPGDSVTMDTINHSEQCLHAILGILPPRTAAFR
ncbi:unnamed protein product [Rhizoctonia solani]|uniref:Zn(2)-C6 fungal-type domain-containing protein n=1 Tax=Rhizoctonia solani TaxID=456999 RepID=A0A8H3HT28_9AGAM|nr:unnamed protein product [Rhizoctonia solani]